VQSEHKRRQFERVGTELDAVFSIRSGAAHTCRLRDYSRGGIYLEYSDQSQYFSIRNHGLKQGDPIQLVISVDGDDCHITANISHYSEAGIGARFDVNHHVNYQALEKATLASSDNQAQAREAVTQSKTSSLTLKTKDKILSQSNECFSTFLDETLNEYLTILAERLIDSAEKQSDTNQHAFFDAIAVFNKKGSQIVTGCIDSVVVSAKEMSIGKKHKIGQGSGALDLEVGQLSLVDKEDFEDWLIVRVLISRAELQFREQLLELQLRLEAVFPSLEDAPLENPYAPSLLCKAFHHFIHGYQFNQSVEKVVFATFQECLIDHLGRVYKQINDIMADEGILPNIDVPHYLATLASKNLGKTAPNKNRETTTKEIEGSDQQSVRSSADQKNVTEISKSETKDKPTGSYSNFQKSMKVAKEAYNTAINLRKLQSKVGQSKVEQASRTANAPASGSSGVAAEVSAVASQGAAGEGNKGFPSGATNPVEVIQSEGLIKAVDMVQGQLSEGSLEYSGEGALIHHIERQIETNDGAGLNIAEEDREKIDMIDALFQSILTNRQVYDELQPKFRKLEVPLLKVMMLDPDFLNEQFHPARQVVNSIAMLSDKESSNIVKNREKIEKIVDAILANYQEGDQAFRQALEELVPLVDKEESIVKRNVARVTESLDGQQRLQLATKAVEKTVEKRLSEKEIPLAFVNLLDNGWKELMRLCYIREGAKSKAWITSVSVIDQLLLRLGKDCYDEEKLTFSPKELYKLIEKGLSKIPSGKIIQKEILNELETFLRTGEVEASAYVEYKSKSVSDNKSVIDRMLDLGATGSRHQLARWAKRAMKLQQGQWVELDALSDRAYLCQLAWISDDQMRFVFVNHHGIKKAEIPLEKLAIAIKDREIKILSDERLPAVEEGLNSLVQKIYDQLSFDSAHDQLTGLATRKEFERCLARSVARAKKSQQQYMLCYIDLVEFKVINNNCGYEGGDSLLRLIANELLGASSKDDVVGRLGSNEFAVLCPVDSENEAFQLATKLQRVVQEIRFTWSEQSYKISASCAMVVFDHTGDHVLELLRGVESACSISKDIGHTEVHVYNPDDKQLEERDSVMSWVARINNALDNDQLKLRCQMISPINDCEGIRKPHYEVLLTVVDDDGEHLPPADFIKAAEEYSRMAQVDRWIIEHVFMWMSDHPAYLETIGGFAINLSGHSLNDDSFLDYIFEKLVEFDIPRNKLVFEVTETTAVANLDDAADFINEMKDIGCRFSLDDFGAGQSSYAYLKTLPVDFIKIDGAFVKDIADDDVDYAMVKSITDMGHFLDKLIVAEYVCSQEILDIVEDIGVDYVQGFHLGKPCYIEDLVQGS